MSYLPKGYLEKKGQPWKAVKLLDVATLIYNIYVGEADSEVGFEDTQETIHTISRKLNKRVFLDPGVLESALWSCNMLQAKGKFFDVKGRTFDQFVKDLLGRDEFNPTYNLIEREGD